MRVAVNFPYFVPYAGYFRLFASTDLFVIFDCVPFPRRGYVHRNQLLDRRGQARWLTLALKKAPRDTCIKDMRFVDNINTVTQRQFKRFPVFDTEVAMRHPLVKQCARIQGPLVDYLEQGLKLTAELLDLPFNVIRSSSLSIDRDLRGERRVLEIVKAVGGTEYVNAPGGRHLYDEQLYKQHGVELNYLNYYQGPSWSILQRLLSEDAAQVSGEIRKQSI